MCSIQEGILSLLDPNNKVFNRAGDLTAGVDLNATDDLEDKNYQPDKVIALLQQKKREVVSQQQAQIEDTDISKLPQAIAASTHKTDLSAQVDSEVSTDWANAALKQLSSKSIKYSRAKKLYSLMRDLNIPIETSNYVDLMSSATLMKMHIEADEYFDTFMKEDRVPSPALWTAKIRNVAKAGHIKQAIVLLDRLQKLSFPMEDAKMHNVVLQAMCDKRLYEDAKEFWIRMHSDGVTLDRESFHIAMAASAYQGEVERCFFYLDEMRANAILPDQESFVILIRACARAPYWVNGYQDSIYDAITALEGAEIIPDVDIYNEVIHAFAQAGDSLAAEYYFWEMRRKGISANVNTYIYLLDSYAKAQSIGAANYGWKGRYVRPAEELLTEEEEAMKALGPEKTARLCKLL